MSKLTHEERQELEAFFTEDQDTLDGAALRRLREALPSWLSLEMEYVHYAGTAPSHPRITLRDFRSGSSYVSGYFDGSSIAEAADKCREALGS